MIFSLNQIYVHYQYAKVEQKPVATSLKRQKEPTRLNKNTSVRETKNLIKLLFSLSQVGAFLFLIKTSMV